MKLWNNISIVLVEPQGDRNIGSVCRAMMNFGFSDLRMVQPQVDHCSLEARKMAVKAAGLLEEATVYPDLSSALADCHLVLGTTRRFGKYREDFLLPEDAGKLLAGQPDGRNLALVFGREDHGLKTQELDLCHRFITIPTSDLLPSMNLAQAVGLCLYEVSRFGEGRDEGIPEGQKPAPQKQLEGLYSHLEQTLLDIDYLDPVNPEHIMRSLRQIYNRAGLSSREVRILRGICRQIDWTEADRRKRLTGGENKSGEGSDDNIA